MKEDIKEMDFDFIYTGSFYSEKEIIEKGYKHLTDKELLSKKCCKTIYGDYL